MVPRLSKNESKTEITEANQEYSIKSDGEIKILDNHFGGQANAAKMGKMNQYLGKSGGVVSAMAKGIK